MPITYVTGDATDPIGNGPKLIAHVCNDRGAWGAGFSGAITRHWRRPEQDYRDWYRHQGLYQVVPFGLGNVRFTAVDTETASGLWVASMVAQHGTRGPDNPKPIRYEALGECLAEVGRHAEQEELSVHMPRIGCGLAGGAWSQVEPLIVVELCERGIPVTIYDLA